MFYCICILSSIGLLVHFFPPALSSMTEGLFWSCVTGSYCSYTGCVCLYL